MASNVAGNNNCAFFNPLTPSFAIQQFDTTNLSVNQYIQFGFSVKDVAAPVTFTDVAYQFSSSTPWITLGIGSMTASDPTIAWSQIVTSSQVAPGLRLKYTIPAGMNYGSLVQSTLITNGNGATVNGHLVGGSSYNSMNYYAEENRSSVAVPGPLPVFGAISAFAMSRRLRRRIKQA
ncbi:MAG: hypothetical protein WAM11_16630 [Cyanobium sp.]